MASMESRSIKSREHSEVDKVRLQLGVDVLKERVISLLSDFLSAIGKRKKADNSEAQEQFNGVLTKVAKKSLDSTKELLDQCVEEIFGCYFSYEDDICLQSENMYEYFILEETELKAAKKFECSFRTAVDSHLKNLPDSFLEDSDVDDHKECNNIRQ